MAKNTFEAPNLSVEDLSKALYETSIHLQQANEKLRMQEKERLEFYANISHDLRAPMTAICNTIEYLESTDQLSPEEFKTTLSLLKNRTQYMKSLINDIFLLSSLESSNDKFHPEPVDVCFFLEDYFYSCEADSSYEQCELSLHIAEDLSVASPTLQLDPHLMQRVLDNLFSNAVKYSDETPYISLSAAFSSPKEITLCVEDHGLGISEEALPRIFDRSYRVDSSRTPGEDSGSGFGLSIVKTIIEHHGGSVRCESTLGTGTRFLLTLPLT